LEQLERDKRIHQKLKRFKAKQAQMRLLFQEVRDNKHIIYLLCFSILPHCKPCIVTK